MTVDNCYFLLEMEREFFHYIFCIINLHSQKFSHDLRRVANGLLEIKSEHGSMPVPLLQTNSQIAVEG